MSDAAEKKSTPRLAICLKQVRSSETPLQLREGRAIWSGNDLFNMSNADEFALEEALCLKDAEPGVEVTAISLGPMRTQDVLRRALGMGADRAVHLLSGDEPPPRPGQVAAALAALAGPLAFDLILTGVMSEDAMHGLVGPMLAEMLDLPCATAVVALDLDLDARLVRVEREMEGGRRQALELPLPALLTIQSSRRAPRYPTLSNLLRAKKAVLPCMDVADLGMPPAREQTLALRLPVRQRAGLLLEGSTLEKAVRLHAILTEKALL